MAAVASVEQNLPTKIKSTVLYNCCIKVLGKHRLGASLIFRKLKVVVEAHTMSNVLNIKIIGADEGKGPVLLLPFFIIAFSPLLDCF